MPLSPSHLRGVVPAVVTPLNSNDIPDLEALYQHIRALIDEGSHGILLLGTTGEGPSMGIAERQAILEAGVAAAGDKFVMVGTGTASLSDTITLTRRAYELGADVTVILPPFYYKTVPDRGVLDYYRRLFAEAVPDDGLVMVYHIPQVTHVPISFNLLEELISVSDGRLVGVKDSSGDAEHARELCRRFPDLNIFVGSDRLLLAGLQVGADGCITAGSNVLGPLAVDVYRAYATGDPAEPLQERLTAARLVFERYQPFPAGLKSLLALRYGGDSWNVRPPLAPLSDSDRAELLLALRNLNLENRLPWLANLE